MAYFHLFRREEGQAIGCQWSGLATRTACISEPVICTIRLGLRRGRARGDSLPLHSPEEFVYLGRGGLFEGPHGRVVVDLDILLLLVYSFGGQFIRPFGGPCPFFAHFPKMDQSSSAMATVYTLSIFVPVSVSERQLARPVQASHQWNGAAEDAVIGA